jgi:hypothetical protein
LRFEISKLNVSRRKPLRILCVLLRLCGELTVIDAQD